MSTPRFPLRAYGEKPITYRSVPKPPPELFDAMSEAAKACDDTRLGILNGQYRQWLLDNGHPTSGPRGTIRPDGAIR